MSNRYEHVWKPLNIGRHQLAHRIVLTPHGVAWAGGNLPYERQRNYYVERAKGGAALVQTGATVVNSRRIDPSQPPATSSDPRVVEMYALFSEQVHEHGAKLFVEMAESGVHERGRSADGKWGTVFGVSALPSMVQNEAPYVLDRPLLKALRQDYVAAARNLVQGGVDGITIHAGHSYLLGQFMSPAYNDRKDEYGGSPQNNLRFIGEIVQDIRDAVGDELAVGLRVSYDEFLGDGGITPEISDEYISLLVETGMWDFFDISAGGYHTGERYVPPQVLPWAPIADYSRRAMEIVAGRARIIMAHRVNTVARADALLADGVADFIGIARGHIADPEIVRKARDGREEETNLCVGSNECVYNLHMNMGVACTVNPAAGREKVWGIGTRSAAKRRQHVVVVGAGPAGLKAGEVASARGHKVTILDREQAPGGSLNLLSSLPFHTQWSALTDQLTAKLDISGATFLLGEAATESGIRALEPDAVVIATGSSWDRVGRTPARPGLPGIVGVQGSNKVYTIEGAVRAHLEDPGSLGGHVVVMDETGAYLPLGAAELFTSGDRPAAKATLVTRRHMIGEIPKETWELPLLWQRIGKRDITVIPHTVIDSLHNDDVVCRNIYSGKETLIEEVSALVICGLRYSNRALYDSLSDLPQIHLIGDALAPRRPADAIYDGERIGRLL